MMLHPELLTNEELLDEYLYSRKPKINYDPKSWLKVKQEILRRMSAGTTQRAEERKP